MAQRTEIPHGTNAGYRRGCRKECCRTAHAESMRAYRDKVAKALPAPEVEPDTSEPTPPRPDLPTLEPEWAAVKGPIERKVREELSGHDAVVSFSGTLGEMLIFNAKILDLTPVHQRFDVASGVQLRMLEIFRRLSETGLEETDDAGSKLIEALSDGEA